MLVTETYLQMLTGNIIVWYIASRCLKKINDILVLSYPVFLALCVQAYYTITAPVEQASNIVNQGLERVSGLSSNENDQARLLLFGVVIAVLTIIYCRIRLLKILLIISIAAFILGILKTGSRECFLALGVMIITFLFLTVKKKKYGYWLLVILLVILFYNVGYDYLLNNTVLGRRMQIAVNQGEQNIRFTLIKEGWNFFLSNPIFGVGLGSFTTLSSSNQYSHNDYIEILASMGLPAFIIYINIYVDYFRKGKKLFSRYEGYYKNAIIVAISFVVGYLCLGIFDPVFYYPPTTLMLAFYYTLISKIYYQYKIKKVMPLQIQSNKFTFSGVRNNRKIFL
jgi:O-antigen ligase